MDESPMTAIELLEAFQHMVRKSDSWRGWVGDKPTDAEVIDLLDDAILAIELSECAKP